MGTLSAHPICTHCNSTKSPLWRRGVHAEILCNACGLYWKHHGCYRPLTLKAGGGERRDSIPREKSPLGDVFATTKRDSNLRRLKSVLYGGSASSDGVVRVKRKMMVPLRSKSSGKITLPSGFFLQTSTGRWRGEPVYPLELAPSTGTANLCLLPAEIRESAALDAPPPPTARPDLPASPPVVRYIMSRGRRLFVGDHVAVRGGDGEIYFAIVHDFWMVPTGQKYVKMQWMLPKIAHAVQIEGPREGIDPSFFTLGPMHEKSEPIEAIIDVFFSPRSLPRPLEGPSPPLQAPSRSADAPSRPTTPLLQRSGSFDEGLRDDTIFTLSVLSSDSGFDTPSQRSGRRPLSDSEVELRRSVFFPYDAPPAHPPPASKPAPSILDDVEMAHLLCSMK